MVDYLLQKMDSKRYSQLICSESSHAIVRSVTMYGFSDVVNFRRRNGDESTYGSGWNLSEIGCFRELRGYTRLWEMPVSTLERLGARMFELLYLKRLPESERFDTVPIIDTGNGNYKSIMSQLKELQNLEKKIIDSGEFAFPVISAYELQVADSW